MAAISSSSTDSSSMPARPAVNNTFRGAMDNSCNSPRSRPVSALSPWSQIVRGDSDAIAPTSSPSETAPSSEYSSSSSLIAEEENAVKKSVWNKPANGSSSELLGVMGGDSWPALSESARVPSKTSFDSSKSSHENFSSILPAQLSHDLSSPSENRTLDGENPNLTSNPSRQRSFKRNASHGSTSQTTTPNGDGEVHVNNPSLRERFSHGRGNGDNHQQRNSYRNRGGVTQYNNFGGQNRNFNGNINSQRNMPRFIRQPPPPSPLPPSMVATSGPFMVPPPPYGGPMGFSDYQMYYFSPPNIPFYPAPLSPVFAPPADNHLLTKIINQIDYYFSNENLVKDTFLRQNMDDQGWVPISLIAGFKKMSLLTDNVQLIMDAVRNSTILELQGDKVRRQNDWMRWVMPSTVRFGGLVNGLQNLSVNESPVE